MILPSGEARLPNALAQQLQRAETSKGALSRPIVGKIFMRRHHARQALRPTEGERKKLRLQGGTRLVHQDAKITGSTRVSSGWLRHFNQIRARI
jgi:hypothetical protein